MHKLLHLAWSFTHQPRCDFRCIAMAMHRKPRLVDTQNPGAILRHSMHDATLGIDVAVRTDVIVWIAFLAGLLSFFSPCVLPLISSYLTYISGLSFAQLKQADAGSQARRAVVFHSLVFISGFSVVFIALGGLAGFCINFSRQL